VSLQREHCIHPFDRGFIPKVCQDRDTIIVTRRSPLISAVSRTENIAFGAALSLVEAGALKPRPRRLLNI
jgi:hypothetical protein